jgi:RNA polymerase sigma-70 factor (ECF subfamily)
VDYNAKMLTSTTNIAVLEGIRGGSPRAWQDFFRVYSPLVLAFAKRLGLTDADAADAVQETLLAVYATFRELQEPFDRSKGRFKHWLRGIALHKVRDVQRRRARREHARTQFALEEADAVADTTAMEQIFDLEWRRDLLARALDQVVREIDPAVYQAFELYVLHEQPPDKVAKLLGTTRNAVYISKTRVLKRLRVVLAELMTEEES